MKAFVFGILTCLLIQHCNLRAAPSNATPTASYTTCSLMP